MLTNMHCSPAEGNLGGEVAKTIFASPVPFSLSFSPFVVQKYDTDISDLH
jgi:hypothetical protein